MKQIFKFPIQPKETVQTINLPEGADILSIGVQKGFPPDSMPADERPLIEAECYFTHMWALVDPTAPARPRHLLCVGTGWEILVDIKRYVGSVVSPNGFVWHLMEVQ